MEVRRTEYTRNVPAGQLKPDALLRPPNATTTRANEVPNHGGTYPLPPSLVYLVVTVLTYGALPLVTPSRFPAKSFFVASSTSTWQRIAA